MSDDTTEPARQRPPCPPPKLEPPPPLPEERNPLYGKMESVDVSKRDEHIAAFKAKMAAERADPSSPWYRKGRKKRG
jgi:hypothetical protein